MMILVHWKFSINSQQFKKKTGLCDITAHMDKFF